jgi:hypothetical protein
VKGGKSWPTFLFGKEISVWNPTSFISTFFRETTFVLFWHSSSWTNLSEEFNNSALRSHSLPRVHHCSLFRLQPDIAVSVAAKETLAESHFLCVFSTDLNKKKRWRRFFLQSLHGTPASAKPQQRRGAT